MGLGLDLDLGLEIDLEIGIMEEDIEDEATVVAVVIMKDLGINLKGIESIDLGTGMKRRKKSTENILLTHK